MASNPDEALEEALRALPMPRLMAQHFHFEFQETGNNKLKFKECPFCHEKGGDKFGAKLLGSGSWSGRWIFGCFRFSCAANQPPAGKDEIGLVALVENLDRNGAFRRYLEMAGVKIERPPRQSNTSSGASHSEDKPSLDSKIVPFRAAGKDKDSSGSPPPSSSLESVWAVLHSRLILNARDRAKLKEQRGFSDETIDALGFKSNNTGNAQILQSLSRDFPMHRLLDAGVFVRDRRTGEPMPNRQFTGWGITKEKDEKGEPIWAQTEPVLIPYLDVSGRVYFIRPHKGNIAKRDRDDDETCGGHVYCPFLVASRIAEHDGLCVLTESEFKAAAIWQALFPAIGIPGTGFVKNPIFREELVALLEQCGVRKLVIIFDNEIKDNPDLGNYKPDPQDRYWTEVWARFMAWDLMNRSPRPHALRDVLVGRLPDEWRKDDTGADRGKVDWDTALADFVRRQKSVIHGTARATREFEKVIKAARRPDELNELFPSETNAIIRSLLTKEFHQPCLDSGGEDQEKLARRLDRIGHTSTGQIQMWAAEMAKALRAVKGCYFIRVEPTDKFRGKLAKEKGRIITEIESLEQSAEPDTEAKLDRLRIEKRLVDEKLRGIPEPVSNFTLKCEYCIHTVDGCTQRLVRITNNQGEKTGLLRLPPESNGRLAEFRIWCLQFTEGVAVWFGGEKDLQSLTRDIKYYTAWRNIFEVNCYGHDPRSEVWFAADRAWAPDGTTIIPDKNNVFWHDGAGYQVDQNADSVGEDFQQGAPLMGERRGEKSIAVRDLFKQLSDGLFDTVGDYDGLLAIGMALLYAAGPEIYREHNAFPGLWLYGKKGGGKNTIAHWLMKLWGFKDVHTSRLDKNCTSNGMERSLSQYSFFPFWFDEYRRNIPDIEAKDAVLRGAFDRSSAPKGRNDYTNRTKAQKARTTPMVSGESSSQDGATRSRYVHVLVAKSRRRKQGEENHAVKLALDAASRHGHLIARYLMEQRPLFAKTTCEHLEIWLRGMSERIPDERTRLVHGAGYAAYMALAEMLDVPVDAAAFAEFLVTHARQAFEDVLDETMVNKFWSDVVSCINRGIIEQKLFVEKIIVLDKEGRHDPKSLELNGAPRVRTLFVAAREVFDGYAEDLRRRGDSYALTKNDIQREISKESYWIEPGGANRVHRIQQDGFRHSGCWALNLDRFPFRDDFTDALGLED